MDCTTTGDGDFYGLGVRLGLYLQWAAGFLLRNSSGSWKMISAVRTTNNALCGAIFLTVLITTARGTALSTDYLIVYYLTVVLFYSESYNLLTKEDKQDTDSKFYFVLQPDVPLLVQNLLFASNHIFGAWFWISGIHHTQSTTCPTKAALLGVFDLYDSHWTRFAAAAAIIGGIIFLNFLCVHLFAFSSHGLTGPVTKVAHAISDCCGPSIFPADLARPLLRPNLRNSLDIGGISPPRTVSLTIFELVAITHFALINLAGPLIAIVSVERILRANHLATPGILESSGQMIALLTGATSLVAALWELGKGLLNQEDKPGTDLLSLQLYQSRKPLDSDAIRSNLQELLKDYTGLSDGFYGLYSGLGLSRSHQLVGMLRQTLEYEERRLGIPVSRAAPSSGPPGKQDEGSTSGASSGPSPMTETKEPVQQEASKHESGR